MNRKQVFTLCAIALALSLAGCQADALGDSEDSSYELIAQPDTTTHVQEPANVVVEPSTNQNNGDYSSSSSLGRSSSSVASSSSSVAASSSATATASTDGAVYCLVDYTTMSRCYSTTVEGIESLTAQYCVEELGGTVVTSCPAN